MMPPRAERVVTARPEGSGNRTRTKAVRQRIFSNLYFKPSTT